MLVSAIIPTYNRARTIERAVNSVLGQSWQPMEIIVVDDGSTDQTNDILARYGDRIRVIRQKNQGPSGARNAGIKAAKGEVITFLDSDDAWLLDKTERQVKLLQATEPYGVKCCVCNARLEFVSRTVNSFDSAALYPEYPEGIWTNPAEILVTRYLFFNQVVAVRRGALEAVGCFRKEFRFMEDYELALRLSLTGPWAFIADPLVVSYRQVGDNITQTCSSLEINSRVLEILQDVGNLPQSSPLLRQDLLRRRIRAVQWQIFAERLSCHPGRVNRFLGKCALACTRVRRQIDYGLGRCPAMVTKTVSTELRPLPLV
jgi:glycosyltransferase involved in cell wall biosynthesis